MRMRSLIPGFVRSRIFQPVIRAQIDNEFVRCHAGRDRSERLRVRKRKEHGIGLLGDGLRRERLKGERHQARQTGEEGSNGSPG